jgi:acetylglutamate kinase
LLGGGFLPVVASMGIDAQGQTYNVNADTVALAVAAALEAAELLLVTEAGGLKRDLASPERLPVCDAALFADGTREGWIQGGMRVKLQVAFGALAEGIETVYILDPDDLLDRAYATRVVP